MIQVRSIVSIATVTFREIVRDKVFYNIVALGFFLFSAAFLASKLTFVRPERVVLSFGLTSFLITGLVLSVLIGASLIPKEYEKRTIYLALSKPLSRFDFLCGKFLGLQFVILINWFVLTLILCGIYGALGGTIGSVFFISCLLLLFQFTLASVFAVFFSTFTTVSLSIILTSMLYLIGSNLSQMDFLSQKSDSAFMSAVFFVFSKLTPQFEAFQVGTKVIYQLPIESSHLIFLVLYTLISILMVLLASGFLLNHKDS